MSERVGFRYTVGMISVLGGLIGLVALYFVEVPPGNRDAVVLALGIVLGWGSSVINGEWGSSPAGRAAAEIGAEVARNAAKPSDSPQVVQIEQPPGQPVPVEEQH
jgi:hypothetical protein